LASGAPPSPFRRPRGIPHRALPWNQSSAFFPRGVRCLSRVLGLRLRPPAPSPSWPLRKGTRPFQSLRVRLSWGSCSHGRLYAGCPFSARASFRSRAWDGSYHTPAGAVLRVLAPLDGSGSSRLVREPCGPRRLPWPPTLCGLLSYRSRPWSVPPELSLPGELYPLSRAISSLRVSRSTAAGAVARGIFTAAFPVCSCRLFARFEPARRRTRDA